MPEHAASRLVNRRTVLGSLAVAAVGAPFAFTALASGATTPSRGTTPKAPKLLWSPVPAVVGLNAFEGIEADRGHKFPNRRYVYVEGGDHYRFNIWANDRDTTGGGDRQRTESKGMVQNGTALKMLNGQTWTISYEMFIPTTLHGTSRFTHIFQTKTPTPDAGPWVTLSLTRNGGREMLQAQADSTPGLPVIASTPLAPLRNKWITIEWTLTIGASGSAKFTARNGTGAGAPVAVSGSRSHLSIPDLGDYVRPKWGIYRSVQSAPADIIDTYLLTRHYQAYRVS